MPRADCMAGLNPYASPAPDGLPSSEASPESTRDLVRLLRAVRCVGVVAVLFALGYLFSFASGVTTYLHFLGDDDLKQSVALTLQLVGALRELIVSLAMVYISIVVWRYAGAISTAIRT